MSQKDILLENYEDALFALLMDEVATAEGEKALEENQQLQDDPDAQIPAELDNRCIRTIHGRFSRLRRRSARRIAVKVVGKTMLAIGVASTLFLTAFATSETVRANTLNLVAETFKERTDFRFIEEAENSAPQISAGWLPDGYELSSEESGNDGVNSWVVYRNKTDGYIHLMYLDGDGSVVSVDTENAEIKSKLINETVAKFVYKENEILIVWGTSDQSAFIRVWGVGIPETELIHVASEIKY